MSTHLVCALLITALSSSAFAQTSLEQQAAKEQGLILYNQNKAPSLQSPLRQGITRHNIFWGNASERKITT